VRAGRQHPPIAGNGSLQVSTLDPQIEDLSWRILRSLDYQGLVAIEYKLDPRDARYKLIEINPRGVSGNQLAIDCGVDLPDIAYRDAAGVPVDSPAVYQQDVKYVHLGWHLRAGMTLWRAGELGPLEWLGGLRGVTSFAIFDVRDLARSVASASGSARMALRLLRDGHGPATSASIPRTGHPVGS